MVGVEAVVEEGVVVVELCGWDEECILEEVDVTWTTRRLPVDRGIPSDGCKLNDGKTVLVGNDGVFGDGFEFPTEVAAAEVVIGWREVST